MLGPIFQLVGQGVDKLTQLRDSREEGADLEAALLQALKLLQAGMVLGEDHVWLLRELRCTSEPAVSCQRHHWHTCHAHEPCRLSQTGVLHGMCKLCVAERWQLRQVHQDQTSRDKSAQLLGAPP